MTHEYLEQLILIVWPYGVPIFFIAGFLFVYLKVYDENYVSDYVVVQAVSIFMAVLWPLTIVAAVVLLAMYLTGIVFKLTVMKLTRALDIVIAKFKKENQS